MPPITVSVSGVVTVMMEMPSVSIRLVDAGRASRQDTDEASPGSYEVMSARPASGSPRA